MSTLVASIIDLQKLCFQKYSKAFLKLKYINENPEIQALCFPVKILIPYVFQRETGQRHKI